MFLKNKTPGNGGLVAEFYLASWPGFGKHLVITLLETKGKDEKVYLKWKTNISHCCQHKNCLQGSGQTFLTDLIH